MARPWYRKRMIELPVYARTNPAGLTLLLYQLPVWAAIPLMGAIVVVLVVHGCEGSL